MIERLVASFMINLSSIYRRHRVIYSGLALNCAGRFQSIRAEHPLQTAEEVLPAVCCTLISCLLIGTEAGLLHTNVGAALRWSQRPEHNGVKPQRTPAIGEP